MFDGAHHRRGHRVGDARFEVPVGGRVRGRLVLRPQLGDAFTGQRCLVEDRRHIATVLDYHAAPAAGCRARELPPEGHDGKASHRTDEVHAPFLHRLVEGVVGDLVASRCLGEGAGDAVCALGRAAARRCRGEDETAELVVREVIEVWTISLLGVLVVADEHRDDVPAAEGAQRRDGSQHLGGEVVHQEDGDVGKGGVAGGEDFRDDTAHDRHTMEILVSTL